MAQKPTSLVTLINEIFHIQQSSISGFICVLVGLHINIVLLKFAGINLEKFNIILFSVEVSACLQS